MPEYMPLSSGGLRAEIKPTGKRKVLRIPYLFHFPYFSGTKLVVNLVMHNDSNETKRVHYAARLFRLAGVAQQPADPIPPVAGGDLEINPMDKNSKILHLANLPQPGNYSLKLELSSDGEPRQSFSGDMLYFDALPKDATTFNVATVIISGLIGVILGLVLGRLAN